MTSPSPSAQPQEPLDRRARRRQETISEILDIALDVMTADGVNALSLSEIARRLGVQPPSLYTYFPNLMSLYDALFERGMRDHRDNGLAAAAAHPPGLAALVAMIEADDRWALEHRAIGELLFWRPVPNFAPSEQAMEPALELAAAFRHHLAEAVRLGELGPGADSDEAVHLLIVWSGGIFAAAASNEPDLPWGTGRFTPLFPHLTTLLTAVYPPPAKPRRTTGRTAPARGEARD
jgi:AcrR family transcriptional regulator